MKITKPKFWNEKKKFKWASGATMDHLVFKIFAFKELEFG